MVKWHGEAKMRDAREPSLNTIGDGCTLERWFDEEEEIFTTLGESHITSGRPESTKKGGIRSLITQTPVEGIGELLVEFEELFADQQDCLRKDRVTIKFVLCKEQTQWQSAFIDIRIY